MICQGCGRPLEEGARFCLACGTAAAACRNCAASLPAEARFCPACGTPTGTESGATPPGSAVPSRERKVATIVFADIVGYTSLNEGHDPELVQNIVSRAFQRLSDEVARYEGVVEKFAGDAMLALFGIPQVHEDDAERAVRAALEMQAAMLELAAERQPSRRPELQLRIGVETGEVLVDLARVATERDRMVTGDPVNTAARLQSVAGAGSIVVGPGTYAATRELVEYEELPPLELKGKQLPVPAWRAVRVRARRGGVRAPLGVEAPLIGRDEELALLKETVRRVISEGRPHIATVIGAAGVGKSRLTWELEKYLDGLPERFHWRKGRCLSYGQPSYGALVEIVKTDAGVRDDDSDELAQRKVAQRLEALGMGEDRPIAAALGVLLGTAADARPTREELFEAWRRYLEAIARVAPLVLITEDIHWADEGLLDFLDFLARWAEAPLLLLCLARHELLERRPGWSGGMANSVTIVLEPLAPAESAALLDALLPGSLPHGFKDRIVSVAEGNPLFAEELIRMLIDRGIARRSRDGWELAAPIDEIEVPRSIHALLAARLDSLPQSEKRVTQAAAVVGRIFWDAVVAHVVAGASPDLERLLRGLRVKELIVSREPSSLGDSREYGFRHVLIRDVAYDSVPKAERARQHLLVARWAEERLAAREEELVELLASHYRSALAYREEVGASDDPDVIELRRRVVEHGRRAGRRAAELWQAAAATQWFGAAVEQATKLGLPPLEQAAIALDYLDIALATESPEVALSVARAAAEQVAPLAATNPEALSILARLDSHAAFLVYSTGRADEARELLEHSLERVADGPPTETRAGLLWRLGWLTWRAYSAPDAVPILERAVAEARAAGTAHLERHSLHDLGIALQYSGRIGEGLALLEQSMALAREAGDQALLLRCYINVPAMMENATWRLGEAEALAREGLDRARRGGYRFFVAFLAGNLGSSAAARGQLEQGLELLEESRAIALSMRDENLIGLAYGFTALLLVRYGRLDEAAEWWREARHHGVAEPQGAGKEAYIEAMFRWPADRTGAVTDLARQLAGSVNSTEALQLARMAARTGQLDEARTLVHALPDTAPGTRAGSDAQWAAALVDPPSPAAVRLVADIAARYESEGFPLVAAEGLADAALLARSLDLAQAEELAARSRALYQRLGATPLLEPPAAETAVESGTAAAG